MSTRVSGLSPHGGEVASQRVRIVYIIDSLRVGGAERHLVRILERLRQSERWDPSVYCLNRRGPLVEVIENLGITVTGPSGGRSKSPHVALQTVETLRRYLVQEKPAIVHCYLPTAGLLGALAARLARVPYVITTRRTVHSYTGSRLLRYLAVRSIMDRCSDAVIAVCEAARIQAIREGTPQHKIVTIYNAVEPVVDTAIQRNDRSQEAVVFGSVGSLHPDKGHRYFVEAMPLVLQALPGARFVLVGDGPEREHLEQRVAELGISAQVEFQGVHLDIQQVLPTLDVFVLPSLREGMPNAVLEAMAWGLPTVATRVGGVPEMISPEETGFLVSPAAPLELAEAMIALGSNPSLRARYSHAARAAVTGLFSPEREFHDTEAVYIRLLNQSSSQTTPAVAAAGQGR